MYGDKGLDYGMIIVASRTEVLHLFYRMERMSCIEMKDGILDKTERNSV